MGSGSTPDGGTEYVLILSMTDKIEILEDRFVITCTNSDIVELLIGEDIEFASVPVPVGDKIQYSMFLLSDKAWDYITRSAKSNIAL